MIQKENSYRISSNLTLFLKLGLPIFWITFFGSITIGFIVSNEEKIISTPMIFRLSILAFFCLFLLILLFTLLRLKRVEIGESHIYVSNYFKTFRYKFEDVARIKEWDFGLFEIFTIVLLQKGAFGRKLPFLVSKTRLKEYLESAESLKFTSKLK